MPYLTKSYIVLRCFLLTLALTAVSIELSAQSNLSSVVSFTLINADNNSDIGLLNDGDTLILNLLPTTNLNVRANTNPSTVNNVIFDYNGVQNYRSEGIAPYALEGDKKGNYNGWTPAAGAHTLSATPNLNGVSGTTLHVNFFVINSLTVDCNGDTSGFAFIDDCGICAGGNTGLVPNANKDTCGVCFGNNSSCAGQNPGNNPSTGASVCGKFPGGRIALVHDGSRGDMDDHGALALSIGMIKWAGLLDSLVFIGHSNEYLSAVETTDLSGWDLPYVGANALSDWSEMQDTAGIGTFLRAGGDTSIVPVYNWTKDYNAAGQDIYAADATVALEAAMEASSASSPLWVSAAGPMDVIYRALQGVTPSKHQYIHLVSHSSAWNEKSKVDGLSYDWSDLKSQFPNVEYHDIWDQNSSNGLLDFRVEQNPATNWDWMLLPNGGSVLSDFIHKVNNDDHLNKRGKGEIDWSDAGQVYYIISGANPTGYQGGNSQVGCMTCGTLELKALFDNQCSDSSSTDTTTIPVDSADCAGILGGSAYLDDCGICAGGNTGLVPNANKDTCGVCFGNNSSCAGQNPGNNPSTGASICGKFPGGRIAMASDGNTSDADDHGATAFAIAMLHYAGLLDKLVFVGHSSLYRSGCRIAYGNWCDIMDSVSKGTLQRFGGDTSIVYSFRDDWQDNNQLDQSIAALSAAIDNSSPGDSIWIYCAGPMDVVYRAIDNASPLKRAYVKCISHSFWNENSTNGGLSYTWADMKQDFTADGVQFYDIQDQNKSNGNLDFRQESDSASHWDWMTQSGNPDWIWLRGTNMDAYLDALNKTFDISDAGMMYWLISGGPNGGCDTCGARQVEDLFNNPCINSTCSCACDSNLVSTAVMLAPNDSGLYPVNGSINAIADVSDPDSNTAYVEFYLDDNLLGIDSTNTYSYNVSGLVTGSYKIHVRAIDTCGESSFTDTITIYVDSADCAGTLGGSAYLDDCGICVGGATGLLANLDKDSCGVCFGNNLSCASIDCNGDTLGTASIDSCGICTGGNTGLTPNTSCLDCNGDPNGQAFIDSCGVCAGGNTSLVPNATCADCNGDVNGSAYIDSCGLCVGGNTGLLPNAKCADCNGDVNGTASMDDCDVCSGGNTGIVPNSTCTDCYGVINGTAFIDSCGHCVGGTTGNLPNIKCLDCNGDINGTASMDECDVCSGGNTGIVPNSTCTDCYGVINGTAFIDSCGHCVGGTTGNLPNIKCLDCNGDINGTASIDECDVCSGGNTGIVPNSTCTDCYGVINGTAFIDSCGDCVGGTTGILPNVKCLDCNGDINGTASMDDCDVCSGGNTGIVPNSTCTDCDGELYGTAFIDSCGECSAGNTGVIPGQSCSECIDSEVVSFTIMEIGLGGPIRELIDGDLLILSSLNVFSIRADICNNNTAGSVGFSLNGITIQIENLAPYAINGDKSGFFNAWYPIPGTYTLTATPYSKGNATGSAGISKTVTFTVISDPQLVDCNGDINGAAYIDQCGVCAGGNTGLVPNVICTDCNGDINGTAIIDTCGVCADGTTGIVPGSSCSDCNGDPYGSATIDSCDVCSGGATGILPNSNCSCDLLEITKLVLVDASTSLDIGPLQNGFVIDLNVLPLFSVKAETCTGEVESVVFMENGIKIQTENLPPYAVVGDQGGKYKPWYLLPGTYQLEAIPYESNNAKGNQGTSKTVTFHVIQGQSSAKSAGSGMQSGSGSNSEKNTAQYLDNIETQDPGYEVSLYPNPTTGELTLELFPASNNASVEIYDVTGKLLSVQKLEANVNRLDLTSFAPGMYWVKVYAMDFVHLEKVNKH